MDSRTIWYHWEWHCNILVFVGKKNDLLMQERQHYVQQFIFSLSTHFLMPVQNHFPSGEGTDNPVLELG